MHSISYFPRFYDKLYQIIFKDKVSKKRKNIVSKKDSANICQANLTKIKTNNYLTRILQQSLLK